MVNSKQVQKEVRKGCRLHEKISYRDNDFIIHMRIIQMSCFESEALLKLNASICWVQTTSYITQVSTNHQVKSICVSYTQCVYMSIQRSRERWLLFGNIQPMGFCKFLIIFSCLHNQIYALKEHFGTLYSCRIKFSSICRLKTGQDASRQGASRQDPSSRL